MSVRAYVGPFALIRHSTKAPARRAAERAQVKREVTEGIAKFRAGDVYRIPAQAQLAWGRA